MKKILAIILAIGTTLAFTACGEKENVSLNLTNLVLQGQKVAGSPTPYASITTCSLKDGYLYFTEKQTTYDATISAAVTKVLGSYKMKLDGTGLVKL